MSSPDAQQEFLRGEYVQAWDHYRHMETHRLQYLGFFFSASLGAAAIAVPLLASDRLGATQRLASLSAFELAFQAITFFVFVSVRRIGAVLAFYLGAMAQLRAAMAFNAGISDALAKTLSVSDTAPLPKMGTWFAVQGTAERILAATLGIGLVASLVTATSAVVSLTHWTAVGASVVAASSASATWSAMTTWIALGERRHRERTGRPPARSANSTVRGAPSRLRRAGRSRCLGPFVRSVLFEPTPCDSLPESGLKLPPDAFEQSYNPSMVSLCQIIGPVM